MISYVFSSWIINEFDKISVEHTDKLKFSVYPMRELFLLFFFFCKELSEANEKLQQEVDDKVIFMANYFIELG